MSAKGLLNRSGWVRYLARQHLDQRYFQAEHIAGRGVFRLRYAQLRREIVRRAEDIAFLQQLGIFAGSVGKAQIEQDGPPIVDEPDVVGLDVAVDETFAMQSRQR